MSGKHKKFKITPIALVALLLAWGTVILSEFLAWDVRNESNAYKIGHSVGRLLVVFVIPLLLGYAVFLISRRKQLAGTIAFVIIPCITILGNVRIITKQVQAKQNEAVVVSLLEQSQEETKQFAQALDNGEYPSRDIDSEYAAAADALRDAAERSSGLNRQIYTAMAKNNIAMAPYERAVTRTWISFEDAGLWATSDLKELGDVQDRISLAEAYRDANAEMLQQQRELARNLYALLLEQGLDEMSAQQASTPTEKLQSYKIRQHEIDEEYIRVILEVLKLYESEWGNWYYDSEQDNVAFTTGDALEQYNAQMVHINDLIAQSEQAMRDLLEARDRISKQALNR